MKLRYLVVVSSCLTQLQCVRCNDETNPLLAGADPSDDGTGDPSCSGVLSLTLAPACQCT